MAMGSLALLVPFICLVVIEGALTTACLLVGLLCFIGGAWTILAQLLIYVWLQESRKTRIGLTCLAVFCILPFVCFILAPAVNRWRGTSKDETETFSNNIESPRSPMAFSPTLSLTHMPIPAPGNPAPRDRVRSTTTMSSSHPRGGS